MNNDIPEMLEKQPYDGSCMLVTFYPIPGMGRFPITLDDTLLCPSVFVGHISKGAVEPEGPRCDAGMNIAWRDSWWWSMEQIDAELQKFDGRVFSIHPSSVFVKLAHLYELRMGKKLEGFRSVKIEDLVEKFHGGAIITYYERQNFTNEVIGKWLGTETDLYSLNPIIDLAKMINFYT